MSLPKGSHFKVVKTKGLTPSAYDLYEIKGLSLGKLGVIVEALSMLCDRSDSVLGQEMLPTLTKGLDGHQTINGT